MINPWGTIYHPTPLLAIIQSAISGTGLPAEGFVQRGRRYMHYSAHSDVHAPSQEELFKHFTSVNNYFLDHIKRSRLLFITLGTAWHFYHRDLEMTVANCHKQSNDLFDRRLSSPELIKDHLSQIITLLQETNPRLEIICTVSPVRHIRDGLIANNRSKAHLLTACHQLCENSKSVHYFAAYELLLDDLRDYRYYDEDLVHPSSQAVNYIWAHLLDHYTDPETQQLIASAEQISKDLAHKAIDPQSEQHQSFLRHIISKMKKLQEKGLDYTLDITQVQEQLDNLRA